jgi:hypothetical protein
VPVKKPQALRQHLLDSVPTLAADPTQLDLFVDRGRLVCRPTASLSFAYRYSLNVVAQNYAGDVNALMVPLLAWIAANEPDLLAKDPHEPFTFETEILDGDRADVSIDLELSERVRIDGGALVYVPDAPVSDSFGVAARLAQIALTDVAVPETTLVPGS